MIKIDKKLYELIFFVTSRCNSKCQHCFNHDNLNKLKDLSLEEIELITKKLPSIENLLLSGGEPFLRDDLPQVIEIFKKNNDIKTLSIPTNGILTEKIFNLTKKILTIDNLNYVYINFSLDGFPDYHDKVRGVAHNFTQVMNSMEKLSTIKECDKRLHVQVNSVILQDNHTTLLTLGKQLRDRRVPDNHFFEIVRPSSLSNREHTSKIQLNFDFYEKALLLQYDYFKDNIKAKNFLKQWRHKIPFLGRMILMYKTQYNNYHHNRRWSFYCTAGENIIVLGNDGLIKLCELRDEYLSLSDCQAKKNNGNASNNTNRSKHNRCYCTHICFIDASMRKSLYVRLLLIPYLGIKYLIKYDYLGYNPGP